MELFDRPNTKTSDGERTLLVHFEFSILDNADLEEFKLLVSSAGAKSIEVITGSRLKPDAALFIGSGKVAEIASLVQMQDIELVVFNHTLSPAQERNLEKQLKCRVLDRNGLILDIFAQRARTHEGKLQVELAQLDHLSTRLVRGWTHLERQKGGIGLRGPGETQLETDRRLLQVRVNQLKAKLEKVRQTRQQGRSKRQKADIPTISLVGYTNAGKSTLFNALAGDDVYAADQLFATLDPTLRRVSIKGVGKVVLADTVGFVRHLPHELVESFRATLEETLQADLLLHIIDSSSEEMDEQIRAVEKVLAEIGADAPIINVYNKIDQTGEPAHIGFVQEELTGKKRPRRVYLSAHTGAGLEKLVQAIQIQLTGDIQHFTLTFDLTSPQAGKASKLRNQLYELDVVQSETTNDDGSLSITIYHATEKLGVLLAKAQIAPVDVLAADQAKLFEPELEEFEK